MGHSGDTWIAHAFPGILGESWAISHRPGSIPEDGKLCDECAQGVTRSEITHIRKFALKMPPVGIEPATSADAPQTITQLPKKSLISIISFPGPHTPQKMQ